MVTQYKSEAHRRYSPRSRKGVVGHEANTLEALDRVVIPFILARLGRPPGSIAELMHEAPAGLWRIKDRRSPGLLELIGQSSRWISPQGWPQHADDPRALGWLRLPRRRLVQAAAVDEWCIGAWPHVSYCTLSRPLSFRMASPGAGNAGSTRHVAGVRIEDGDTCSHELLVPGIPFVRSLAVGDAFFCNTKKRAQIFELFFVWQNEIEYGGDEASASPRLQAPNQHPQSNMHFANAGMQTSSGVIAQAAVGHTPRASQSDQAKNLVFSNTLSSPVEEAFSLINLLRRLLPKCCSTSFK
ncbi:hypothetical protein J5N97_006397 [Dioscorea zingiberensis]|uniref:Uncharacterized protein n=1 Tax=Dioscorea zingiberensis TaxID=325984 RepID=A0A9D5D9Z4_9LILI|nr:hypothetical protein J5N97_006397 [Dioscorea zingiberensis]